ncbi:hypothetical protein QO009_004109 [Brevibacillus aydinogluensis]|jgi:hypothetical protein|uniref:hypothetical protein n=1 Tax=Brevibacillus aydinogluensis TaxID=927786 RepID=UPI002892ACBA|nr:hypothetical protein [Brevibacillus aydinogluensis]MDT3418184.1 hypothetical protein [Brevibacillus aydinogluensis]
MNAVKRSYLKELVAASYRLAMELSNKEEDDLSIEEQKFLNTVNDCAEWDISAESVDGIGREVSVFTNRGLVGVYEYHEIFGERDLVAQGTVIKLDDKSYVVLNVTLRSDKSIKLEVKSI